MTNWSSRRTCSFKNTTCLQHAQKNVSFTFSLWWSLVLIYCFPQSTGSLTPFRCVLWRLVYAHWTHSSLLGQGMIPQTGAHIPQTSGLELMYKDTHTTAHSRVPLCMRKTDQGIDTNYYTSVWAYNKNQLVMVEMQRIRLISEILCLHEPPGAVFSYTASKFSSEWTTVLFC